MTRFTLEVTTSNGNKISAMVQIVGLQVAIEARCSNGLQPEEYDEANDAFLALIAKRMGKEVVLKHAAVENRGQKRRADLDAHLFGSPAN